MRIASFALGAAAAVLLMGSACLAQDQAPPIATNIVSCRPFNNNGEATRILSLNDVCPQYAFFREDCQRDVKSSAADPRLYSVHCLDQDDFRRFSFK
jgi:hypothetical protein